VACADGHRLMAEVNRLRRYPVSTGRNALRPLVTEEDHRISKEYGFDYFDGNRRHGYGGYRYHPRFWTGVAEDLRDAYGLKAGSRVLDIGSGKGFLLHDLRIAVPGVETYGLDISAYGLTNTMEDVRPTVARGTAAYLPFKDATFDAVLCINTIHNLPLDLCKRAVCEIERVKRPGGHSYIQVDSWLSATQRDDFADWVLTAQTYFEPAGWKALFAECGYSGDFYWTLTE
jgi:SAM-dependent methyltransferase